MPKLSVNIDVPDEYFKEFETWRLSQYPPLDKKAAIMQLVREKAEEQQAHKQQAVTQSVMDAFKKE